MKGLDYIERLRNYLDYLEEHLNNVQKAWQEVQKKCADKHFIYDDFVFWTIDSQVNNHDLSKFSKEEFTQYCQHFYPLKNEKINPDDFENAWKHHYQINHHHWETSEINPYSDTDIVWIINLVHMVIDWLAMSYKFGDTPRQYYEKHKDEIILSEPAIKFIYEIFECLEKRSVII